MRGFCPVTRTTLWGLSLLCVVLHCFGHQNGWLPVKDIIIIAENLAQSAIK